MKLSYTLLFILCALLGCSSQQEFRKADISEIDQEKLELARLLSDKILSVQREGDYYPLSEEEATYEMVWGLGEDLQKSSYKEIEKMYGEYKEIEFDHLMKSVDSPHYEVYRFRGKFEISKASIEVRCVFDNDGKLAGFFVKPWKDRL